MNFQFGCGRMSVEFSYQMRLTAIGSTAYLNNRGAYLRPAESEFSDSQGVRVEIINLFDTGGINAGTSNVVFDTYTGFSTANSIQGSFMTFTPNNVAAANQGASNTFDRVSADGKDTITLAVDDTTTVAQWTQGATSMDIYSGAGTLSGELRNLIYRFDTVAVPEPSTGLLFALGGFALHRRLRPRISTQ